MSFITRIDWQGASTFEEIDIWFCDPMRKFLEMFDEYYEEDNDSRATFFYYEMRSKVDDLTILLNKLWAEYRKNPVLPSKSSCRDKSESLG